MLGQLVQQGGLSALGTQYSSSAGLGSQSGPPAAYTNPWMTAAQGAVGGGLLGASLRDMYRQNNNNNYSNIGSDYNAHAGSLSRANYG